MLTFCEMHLTVFRRESGEEMVAFNASKPTVPEDGGLSYLSFYMTGEEFTGLLTGKINAVNDLGHNVRRSGELYTFFDLDFPSRSAGVMKVPYANVQIAHYTARILVRAVRLAWRKAEPGGERIRIELPYHVRGRWALRYGQGTGKVEVDHGDRAFYDECGAIGGESFERCMANLRAIAQNQTYRATDTAKVVLRKDWDGFYFRILSPRGQCVLNGGVINHGRDGAPSWSTHT